MSVKTLFQLSLCLLAPSLYAANYQVTTAVDEDNGTLSTGDGAGRSLREAILYSASDDVITFAEGLNGAVIALQSGLNCTHDLEIDASALADGITVGVLGQTVDDEGNVIQPGEFGLLVVSSDISVLIDSLTFTGGIASDSSGSDSGGAILNSGSLSLRNCNFISNTAESNGGAIGNFGNMSAIDCIFTSNVSEEDSGFGGGAIFTYGRLTLLRCDFVSNSSRVDGGAVCAFDSGGDDYLSIEDCNFSQNSSAQSSSGSGGGAVAVYSESIELIIKNCEFSDNTTGGSEGGGALYLRAQSFEMTDCVFSNNTSSRSSGGALLLISSSGQVQNTRLFGNHAAGDGGAIAAVGLHPSEPSIVFTNCLFVGNSSSSKGGALSNRSYFDDDRQASEIINCTFVDNSAGVAAGAIVGESQSVIYNSILWGNEAPTNPQYDDIIVDVSSLIQGETTDAQDLQFVRAPNAGDEDWLTPDDNDYGDLQLQSTSAAIGMGLDGINTESLDLAGQPRVIGPIDVGAYEYQGTSFTVDQTGDDGPGSLRSAIENSVAGAVINFDASLSGAVMTLASTLSIDTSLTIDATSLPQGVQLGMEGEGDFDSYTVIELEDAASGSDAYTLTLRGLNLINVDGNHQGVYAYGNLIVESCRFEGFNVGNGPAIDNGYEGQGSLRVENSSFFGNYGSATGAIYWDGSGADSSITLINCAFAGNTSYSLGRSNSVFARYASIEIINCTFSQNNANARPALYISREESLALKNCIFWGNHSSEGGDQYTLPQASDSVILSNNWVEGVDGASDPQFAQTPDSGDGDWTTLSDNFYGDLRLLTDSPALDAGDGSSTANSVNSSTHDLLGNTRFNGTIDLGAYERVDAMVVTNLSDEGQGSLRDALARVSPDGTVTFDDSLNGGTIELMTGLTIAASLNLDASALSEGVELTRSDTVSELRLLHVSDDYAATQLDVSITGMSFSHGYRYGSASGVYNYENLELSACAFSYNRTGSGNGAALYNDVGGVLDAYDCVFFDNYTRYYGSGFYNIGTATLANCLFQDNVADSRGGGAANADAGSTVFVNCGFVNNTAKYFGGGLSNVEDSSSEMINCSFSQNSCLTSGIGGAVYHDSTGTNVIQNSILWGNTAPTSPEVHGAYTGSHNLIAGVDGATDPLFADPVSDLRLLSGSPALDAGDNALNIEPLDLGGEARVNATTIDLGAYEGAFVTFAHLYPALNAEDDANGNGVANFIDYAKGSDPTATGDLIQAIRLDGQQVAGSFRTQAADVNMVIWRSSTLQADSWVPMVEGVDYQVDSMHAINDRTEFNFDLLSPALADKMFFRTNYSD